MNQTEGEEKKAAEKMKENLKGKSENKLILLVCTIDSTGQLGFSSFAYPDEEGMKPKQFTDKQGEGQIRIPAGLTSF
ncbi:MAG: hypothetical protein NPIRA06_29670 [Nitrospirales bacterium]|nr:MAG: hypothetical protein NPIRA06_29670 [Nitrospirales bacterium]